MNAREKLKALQLKYPLPRGGVTQAMLELARARGLDPGKLTNLLEDTMPDPASENLRLLLSVAPKQLNALYASGDLAAGTVGRSEVDAYMTHEAFGGASSFTVVVNLGFTHFLYRAAKAIALIVPEGESKADWKRIPEIAELLADVTWWYSATQHAYASVPATEPYQTELALRISHLADLFCLAHELGHVWHSIVGKSIEDGLPPPPTDVIEHRAEHFADALGLDLLMDVAPIGLAIPDKGWALAGAEFGLQIFRAMERAGLPHCSSHPLAATRIEYLREWGFGLRAVRELRRSSSGLAQVQIGNPLSEVTEYVFDRALQLIDGPATISQAASAGKRVQFVVKRLRVELEVVTRDLLLASGDAALVAFLNAIQRFGSPSDLSIGAAQLAVEFSDSVASVPLLALTRTDQEILQLQSKARLLFRAVAVLRQRVTPRQFGA